MSVDSAFVYILEHEFKGWCDIHRGIGMGVGLVGDKGSMSMPSFLTEESAALALPLPTMVKPSLVVLFCFLACAAAVIQMSCCSFCIAWILAGLKWLAWKGQLQLLAKCGPEQLTHLGTQMCLVPFLQMAQCFSWFL